jgi:hypothetical protein
VGRGGAGRIDLAFLLQFARNPVVVRHGAFCSVG